jgi:hypothetical protein
MGAVPEMTMGLNAINKVNFDPPNQPSFTTANRAELLRIKAELLLRIPGIQFTCFPVTKVQKLTTVQPQTLARRT